MLRSPKRLFGFPFTKVRFFFRTFGGTPIYGDTHISLLLLLPRKPSGQPPTPCAPDDVPILCSQTEDVHVEHMSNAENLKLNYPEKIHTG